MRVIQKAKTNEGRKEKREEAKQNALQAHAARDYTKRDKHAMSAVSLTPDMVDAFIEICIDVGYKFIVSQYEGSMHCVLSPFNSCVLIDDSRQSIGIAI